MFSAGQSTVDAALCSRIVSVLTDEAFQRRCGDFVAAGAEHCSNLRTLATEEGYNRLCGEYVESALAWTSDENGAVSNNDNFTVIGSYNDEYMEMKVGFLNIKPYSENKMWREVEDFDPSQTISAAEWIRERGRDLFNIYPFESDPMFSLFSVYQITDDPVYYAADIDTNGDGVNDGIVSMFKQYYEDHSFSCFCGLAGMDRYDVYVGNFLEDTAAEEIAVIYTKAGWGFSEVNVHVFEQFEEPQIIDLMDITIISP
jgi:hypothetical protein